MSTLKIKSHVGRDVLQSAQSFRTLEAAVWEYVVNSLQYVDPGVTPCVSVILNPKAKTITVTDNGAGMDHDGLAHFFTMHAENPQRRKGIPGRGKFGTGKSAAFGVGNSLQVVTVRDGRRQKVYVDRPMIEAADGAEIPIQFVERDGDATREPNGTTILISDVVVPIKREPVIYLIERHLSAFRSGSPVVVVNEHVCEIKRPQASLTRDFTPTEAQKEILGDISLKVSASVVPLDPDHRGVQVTVGTGNLVAVEAAGVDSKEYGNRLFGEVDCPELDNPKYDPVAAYGNNRDLRLNRAHPVAMALTAFIGASLEQMRATFVEEAKKARADADAKRLKETTDAIASILNADLVEMRDRLQGSLGNIRRRTPLPASAAGEEPDESNYAISETGEPGTEDGVLGENVDIPEPVDIPTPMPGPEPTPPGENASPAGTPDRSGTEKVTPAGGTGHTRPRGGVIVDTDHFGPEEARYLWDKGSRVITINLDHPVVVAARALNDDEVAFRRLCHEIAFSAYAVALADLQLERDEAMDASDAMYEVRQALERVWRRAEGLYAA